MFLHTSAIRKIITIPSYILDDADISLGAKGLYVQLFYSNKNICALNELTSVVNATEDELKLYFEELTEKGYITIKDNRCDLLQKAVTDRSSRKTDTTTASTYAETTQPKKLSAYEKMILLVDSYDLAVNVKNALKTYFGNWLERKGRYAEADILHGNKVRSMIGELISFHLSEEDELKCIQNSIDREWFKFVQPVNQQSSNTSNGINSFSKDGIQSNSYTKEDIEELKRRALEMEANGEKGVF